MSERIFKNRSQFMTLRTDGTADAVATVVEQFASLLWNFHREGESVEISVGLSYDTLVQTDRNSRRKTKFSAQHALAVLIETRGTSVFKDENYDFNFKDRRYHWKGEEIHLSAGEQFHIYQILVEGLRTRGRLVSVYNARRRLGHVFLAEVC